MNSDPAINTERAPNAKRVGRTGPVRRERVEPSESRDGASSGRALPQGSAAWIVGLLQAGDSFYPTGSYAHSFGLEGLVQAGVVHDRATLREFLFRSVLPSLQQAELPIAAHAWRAFGEENWEKLAELCAVSAALKAARELRLASENIGRQRAELTALLHAHPLAQAYAEKSAAAGWPHAAAVSAALEGRVLGSPLVAVLAGIYYATVVALVSAAMKILRLGQNASQTLLAETLAEASRVIAAAELVPLDAIGWFNPWLDIASARHELADARMFIS